jgi:glycosyltransferase involved in cell wall biosynthesis
MRILKVWDGEYPWDVRAEKVCRALTEAGHDVHMVARNRDGRPRVEQLDECTVHRLAPWSVMGSRFDAASQFPAFFNPRWLALMLSVGRKTGADLTLVRDLPLAPTAVLAGRLLGTPVVLDMAENYPAMIRDLWTTGATRRGDLLVRNPRAVEWIERWTVRKVNHILVVVEESRDRLVRSLGVPMIKITVVGNTPPASRVADFPLRGPSSASAGEEDGSDGTLDLVYLGLMEEARGVGTVIDAVAEGRKSGIPLRLTLIGDGRARPAFEARIREQGLGEDAVRILGYVPYHEALELVARADVGLIPHLANESWNTTIPNKLFDYMAAGLAVVTSDARPARRVVREVGCGEWFRSGDPVSLLGALERLWSSGSSRDAGARGRDAILGTFNWEADRARMLGALEPLARARR